jgi:hypothetical protein
VGERLRRLEEELPVLVLLSAGALRQPRGIGRTRSFDQKQVRRETDAVDLA